ncbi:MAG: DUF3822 family protein [Bacteroidales bacterium]|nr:DUF3822 family protein [Bacteroidales bacterium]
MINCRIIDDLFETGNCKNYILSIQCSLNGFSFLVYDTISGKFIAHIENEAVFSSPYELKKELELRINSEAILNQTYKRVVVSYQNMRFILVPAFVDTEDNFEKILQTVFDKESDEHLASCDVFDGARMLFALPNVLFSMLSKKYTDCIFIAPPMPLIRNGLANCFLQPTLFVARFSDLLILILFHEKKVHFINQFYVKNDTDCLYYILNTASQLKLDMKTNLRIFGKISRKSVLVSMLQGYFMNVEFASTDKRFASSLSTNDGHEHFLIPQIELTLCE